MNSHNSSHMTVKVHPQTCQLHFVDAEVYKEKLERAVRALYHPMGVSVAVDIMPTAELPDEDFSEDWGVYLISMEGMESAEARAIRGIAGRVFGGLMKGFAPRLH